jgi:hypothetical protein
MAEATPYGLSRRKDTTDRSGCRPQSGDSSSSDLAVKQLLSVTGSKLYQGGTFTLLRTLTPKRTGTANLAVPSGNSPPESGWTKRSLTGE